jgi:hypothetical protein
MDAFAGGRSDDPCYDRDLVLTVATSLAHALELPGKMRLSREQYLAVQAIYYPGFTYAGLAEPLSIVALAVLLLLSHGLAASFWLVALALAAAMLTHLLYWVLVAPVNKVWLKGEALSAPARQFFGSREDRDRTDWISLRNRWEWSHVCRAASSMAAFLLLLVAVLGPLREDGHF